MPSAESEKVFSWLLIEFWLVFGAFAPVNCLVCCQYYVFWLVVCQLSAPALCAFCAVLCLLLRCFGTVWRGTAAKACFWIRLITSMLPLVFGIKKTMVFFAPKQDSQIMLFAFLRRYVTRSFTAYKHIAMQNPLQRYNNFFIAPRKPWFSWCRKQEATCW